MDKFSALSDPTRRNIIDLLSAHGELTVNDIFSNFHISQPAISQHLKVLREASLVEIEKRAQQRLYSLNFKGMLEVETWIQSTTQHWNSRLDALDKVLQAEKTKSTKI
jgi:DNA-binding transcriptional ArsR family regulator